ncbi:uncharacterized protein B0I36DRAFT_387337 [Microdochium trichocladiopsis]|uniref:2EXR domain-containing protein n=1 Tax=Microdochium trichocladiopsis TaxID=1682393 RepID=A0A9P8XYJ9_9PEZI|nr:uncharacterized protein B0I36DRAFT_387337 [Microdochium trichocladiopsis]KAH7024920.1 hypothetical protein B0I36DRAFT_387337 [Microdochium trichocladiopsis]
MTDLSLFHSFPKLPFELRRQIYLLATPQRVVHVQERFDPFPSYEAARQDFHTHCEALCTQTQEEQPRQPQGTAARRSLRADTLHPSLAYHGATYPWKVPRKPGEPEPVPLERLQRMLDRDGCPPKLLWQTHRRSQLFSRAPIPAFLHVCAESRQVLIESGYELAFGTRATCSDKYTAALWAIVDRLDPGHFITSAEEGDGPTWAEYQVLFNAREHGGLTWFNFAADTLYVGDCEDDYVTERELPLLYGDREIPWNLSVFLPQDLTRARRLALGDSSRFVNHAGEAWAKTRKLCNLLRLFPSLDEVLLAEWALMGSREQGHGPSMDQVSQDRRSRASEPWFYLPMCDVDIFSRLTLKYDERQYEHIALGRGALACQTSLRKKRRPAFAASVAAAAAPAATHTAGSFSFFGDNTSVELLVSRITGPGREGPTLASPSHLGGMCLWYETDIADGLQRNSTQDTAAIMPRAGGSKTPKTCPRVTLAHIGTEAMLETLQDERAAVWADPNPGRRHERNSELPYGLQSLTPGAWNEERGWTAELVEAPRREQVVFSVVERGLKRDKVDVKTVPKVFKATQFLGG